MQTIYAFSYNPVIATGTNTTGTNWRMAYQQPIMLYKGTTNQFRLVVFSVNQKVVNLTNYDIQVQLVDKETQEHFITKTAVISTPTSGVATITFTEQDLRYLQHRFYHLIARLVNPEDGSSITSSEILYLDDNYGAFTPVTIEDAWNFSPSTITTVDGPLLNVGNIIPILNDTYWLGNVTNRWAHVHATTANIANISILGNQIESINDNIKITVGSQIFEFIDNSTDPSHQIGDGGFLTFFDNTHLNDGPRLEIWYGNPDTAFDIAGQHSLDIRAPDIKSYVEFASYDLNTFMGVKTNEAFIQVDWNNDPTQGWLFGQDGTMRLSRQGILQSYDGNISLAISDGFIDVNSLGGDSTWHQTRFDKTGEVYFGGNLYPGSFDAPSLTPEYSLGSVERPWKDLYLSNSTIYLGDVPISVDNTGNLTINGSVVASESAILGNFKILGNTLGTKSLDESSWGSYNMFLDPGGESSAYINIPSVNEQLNGGSLQIYNGGAADSIVQLFGRGGVQVVTNFGINEKVFEFRDDGKLQLPLGGDILNSNGASVLGGGAGPIQPYIELTNDPFITQPAILGTPVTVTAAPWGNNAQFQVDILEGPVLGAITITQPGTGYLPGQNYIIFNYQIGYGGDNLNGNLTFTVDTVDGNGGILTITNIVFTGTPTNSTGSYGSVSITYLPSVFDEIDTGLVLTRGSNQGIFNIEAETDYDNSTYLSPLGTAWNADGWGDLTGLGTRSYTTWRQALNNQVGNYILGAELVMHDTINDKYYKFDFTNWGGNNGGFAYTRTLVTDPNYFNKTDNGEEVDIIVPDDGSTLGVAITRSNNQGIFNPLQEQGWDSDVSPAGTLWNIDGWDDLTNIEDRDYTNLYAAFGNGELGNKIVGTECVMYVPLTNTYYAVKFLSWTQNNNGGGFSYTRKEIDLSQLNQGIKFADGSVLKSASDFNRIKSTASGERRIEEVSGSKSVVVTPIATTNLTTVTSRSGSNTGDIWIDTTATTIDDVLDNPANYNNAYGFEFSLNDINWYPWNYSYGSSGNERGYGVNGPSMTYNQGDTVYFRYKTGGDPVVWWDKNDLPNGGNNFRGAVIDYHAYSGEATWIGTIHIVDDSGEEHISHTEVASGSTDSENDDLWLVQNEGTISYRRIDGESKTLKVHWTAKVFYGSEFWD